MIKELNEKFARARTAIVAEFSKLNVETVTRLRKKFRDSGVDYKVLKNTLARRAAKGTPVEVVSDDFKGPVAIAIGYDDVVVPAKMPGLPELRAKILGMLTQPAGKLARTVAEPGSRLARLIKARAEALEKTN